MSEMITHAHILSACSPVRSEEPTPDSPVDGRGEVLVQATTPMGETARFDCQAGLPLCTASAGFGRRVPGKGRGSYLSHPPGLYVPYQKAHRPSFYASTPRLPRSLVIPDSFPGAFLDAVVRAEKHMEIDLAACGSPDILGKITCENFADASEVPSSQIDPAVSISSLSDLFEGNTLITSTPKRARTLAFPSATQRHDDFDFDKDFLRASVSVEILNESTSSHPENSTDAELTKCGPFTLKCDSSGKISPAAQDSDTNTPAQEALPSHHLTDVFSASNERDAPAGNGSTYLWSVRESLGHEEPVDSSSTTSSTLETLQHISESLQSSGECFSSLVTLAQRLWLTDTPSADPPSSSTLSHHPSSFEIFKNLYLGDNATDTLACDETSEYSLSFATAPSQSRVASFLDNLCLDVPPGLYSVGSAAGPPPVHAGLGGLRAPDGYMGKHDILSPSPSLAGLLLPSYTSSLSSGIGLGLLSSSSSQDCVELDSLDLASLGCNDSQSTAALFVAPVSHDPSTGSLRLLVTEDCPGRLWSFSPSTSRASSCRSHQVEVGSKAEVQAELHNEGESAEEVEGQDDSSEGEGKEDSCSWDRVRMGAACLTRMVAGSVVVLTVIGTMV
ncbi:hypothetical protein C8Q77DRAFT_924251 [Trametes polyzona]|nr:hypothetical protein C8Q77DRAFT_924251 [Trametes polyzona]